MPLGVEGNAVFGIAPRNHGNRARDVLILTRDTFIRLILETTPQTAVKTPPLTVPSDLAWLLEP